MERRTFPALPPTLGLNLKAVERMMEFDAGFLTDPRCPYPEELKIYLRRLTGPVRTGKPDTAAEIFKENDTDEQQVDSVIVEIQNALNSMRRLQIDMEATTTETKERLDFFKNYSSLMDRFIALKEKANGVKQMYEFQRLVISVLEQEFDKDQILSFKERLATAGIPSSS